MITLTGKGVFSGVAIGKLSIYNRRKQALEIYAVHDIEQEIHRAVNAIEISRKELSSLADAVALKAGKEQGEIFEIHKMMLDDKDFLDSVLNIIRSEKKNAEYAVAETCRIFSQKFSSMEDEYMKARAVDVKDISDRVIRVLSGTSNNNIPVINEPSILVADDLMPSEIVQLDKSLIIGIATIQGSENSHVAILARNMGIPMICSIGKNADNGFDGDTVCLDGEKGVLILNPDLPTLQRYRDKCAIQLETVHKFEKLKGKADITLDGRKMNIYCNIGTPEDVSAVLANDGSGIGLFRSELLYLAAENYPTEEEQFEAYKTVALKMDGKPVIIRTLDIGADKKVDYFGLAKEANPAMGIRAIRICLTRPEIFRTQLRAIYRASAYGKVAIMFPMITSTWEINECRKICASVAEELKAENVPFDPDIKIGIMIETPASVFIADELAPMVDFFSVGTNDLTQYTLACDRQNNALGRFFDPHHPAIIRALKIAADAAHKAGIWIGICGELGADLSMLETFLAIGIDELSVAPSQVLPLRAVIRDANTAECTLNVLD